MSCLEMSLRACSFRVSGDVHGLLSVLSMWACVEDMRSFTQTVLQSQWKAFPLMSRLDSCCESGERSGRVGRSLSADWRVSDFRLCNSITRSVDSCNSGLSDRSRLCRLELVLLRSGITVVPVEARDRVSSTSKL